MALILPPLAEFRGIAPDHSSLGPYDGGRVGVNQRREAPCAIHEQEGLLGGVPGLPVIGLYLQCGQLCLSASVPLTVASSDL